MRPWTVPFLPLALAACTSTDDSAINDSADPGDTDTGLDTADTADSGETGDTATIDEDHDGFSPPEDCNDQDAAVNPNANESCNEIDDDCDGETDENTGGTWYDDADADGWGTTAVWACTQPAGTTELAGDCDDGDASAWPGAPEVCGDERVNDCGGTEEAARDACPVLWPTAAASLDGMWTEPTASGAGGASVAMGDVDGDGLDDVLVGAPYADTGDERGYAGRAHLVLATAATSGALDSVRVASISGTTQYGFLGQAVAIVPDLDGDGLDDVVVGAPASAQEGSGAYVFLGGLTGDVEPGAASASYVNGGWTGTSVAGAGDLDGDGHNDLLVGNPGQQNEGYVGQVDLFRGPVSGALTASGWLRGRAGYGGELGTSADGAGDFNGDGLADLVLGAPAQWVDETQRGSAYVVLGAASLPESEVQDVAELTLVGETASAQLGNAVAGVGDTDGDGLDDVVVGERYGGTDRAGVAYLVFGGASGDVMASAAPVTLTGVQPWGYAGYSVAAGGDADGDGLADVLVGAPGDRNEGVFAGAAYLVLGGGSGTIDLAGADAATTGDASGDGFASALASGDHDGDGRPDVVFGAPGAGTYGATYLLHGPKTW